MAVALRKTGLSALGDVPWGTLLCFFYETKSDLLDGLVPFFRAGLENNEFCLWAVSEPITHDEARQALRQNLPGFDRYYLAGAIEIVSAYDGRVACTDLQTS